MDILSPLDHLYQITTGFFGKVILGPRTGQQHNALDYSTPVGTPVYAVVDAVVTRADNKDIWGGNTIQITEFTGSPKSGQTRFDAIYAHLDQMYVKPGDTVKAGQQIGTTGNTGQATTGPHLYFETRINNQPVDPTSLIKGFPIPGAVNPTVSQANAKDFQTRDPVSGQCPSGWVLGSQIQDVLFQQFGTLPIIGGIIGWTSGLQFGANKCYNRKEVSDSAFAAAQAAGSNPVSNTVGAIGDAAYTIGIILLGGALILAGALILRQNNGQ